MSKKLKGILSVIVFWVFVISCVIEPIVYVITAFIAGAIAISLCIYFSIVGENDDTE